MAATHGRAETLNFDDEPVHERLIEMTNGRGPDRCIGAVGAEAHGTGTLDAVLEKTQQAIGLSMD